MKLNCMNTAKKSVNFIVIFCWLLSSQPGWAIGPNDVSFLSQLVGRQSHSEFVIQEFPGQKLITVRLLSGVALPGTYRIPKNTHLTSLISFSGGLREDADLTKIQIAKGGNRGDLYQVDLDDVLHRSKLSDIPLGEKDVIFIPARKPTIDNNTMSMALLISTITSVILTAFLIEDEVNE
jgi:hypothetical protein